MKREDVYKLIDGERDYQDRLWNKDTATNPAWSARYWPASGGDHTPDEWIVYMEDYLLEAKHILAREPAPACLNKAMEIIRKVTAMGVCAMERRDTKARQ